MLHKILFSVLIIVGLILTTSSYPNKSNKGSCEEKAFDGSCCSGDHDLDVAKYCVAEKSFTKCACDQYCLDGDELRSDCCPDYREWCKPKLNADPSCNVLSNNGTCCQGKNKRCLVYNLERSKKCYCDENCIDNNDCCKDYQYYCQTPGVNGYFNIAHNLEILELANETSTDAIQRRKIKIKSKLMEQ